MSHTVPVDGWTFPASVEKRLRGSPWLWRGGGGSWASEAGSVAWGGGVWVAAGDPRHRRVQNEESTLICLPKGTTGTDN